MARSAIVGLAIGLLCLACALDARACTIAPFSRLDELVRDARAFGLAQVQSITEVDRQTVYRIRIQAPLGGHAVDEAARNSPYEFEVKVPIRDEGVHPWSGDFARHSALEFWAGGRSAQPYDISCDVRLKLATGVTYLAFDTPRLTTRNFEIVNSSDDLWLQAALHYANPDAHARPKLSFRSIIRSSDIATVYDCPVSPLPVSAGARNREALIWALESSANQLLGLKAPCLKGDRWVVLTRFPDTDAQFAFRMRAGAIESRFFTQDYELDADRDGIDSVGKLLGQYPFVSRQDK